MKILHTIFWTVSILTMLTGCGGGGSSTEESLSEKQSLHLGDLIVSELMTNPSTVTAEDGEWIELFNTTNNSIILDGLRIKGWSGWVCTINSAIIDPHSYMVIARNTNELTNGGFAVDVNCTGILSLKSNGGKVSIIDSLNSTILDEVPLSTEFYQLGISNELSINHLNHLSNNVLSRWCDGNNSYGPGGLGTPGTVNNCSL